VNVQAFTCVCVCVCVCDILHIRKIFWHVKKTDRPYLADRRGNVDPSIMDKQLERN
jgi:hypothetical protein